MDQLLQVHKLVEVAEMILIAKVEPQGCGVLTSSLVGHPVYSVEAQRMI